MDADAAWNQMERVRRQRWKQSVRNSRTANTPVTEPSPKEKRDEVTANEPVRPPTLTDAERSLLTMLVDRPRTHELMHDEEATLRGLLERTEKERKNERIFLSESDHPDD
jgi:hypothetical protein